MTEFKPQPVNNVLLRNVKLIHNIEIRLITKIVGIIVLTSSER